MTWRYIVSGIAAILFCVFCLYTCPVRAEVLVRTDTMLLKNVVYEYGTHKIICHWLENPRLLGGKVNTGLSCVVIPACPACPPCPDCEKNKLDNEPRGDSLF